MSAKYKIVNHKTSITDNETNLNIYFSENMTHATPFSSQQPHKMTMPPKEFIAIRCEL